MMHHINTMPAVELAQQLAQQFATRADAADVAGKLPAEDVQALRASGYLSLSIPQLYGGPGLSLKECLAAQLELAQGSGSTALVAGMPIHIFGHAHEIRLWPEETFARLCQAIVNGALVNSVASEPLLGSPSRGGLPQTSATPHPSGRGWLLNGHKTWSTGGRHLTHLLVNVRLEDEPAIMLVLQDTPGVEWVETWSHSLSLRASDSHDVYFKDVAVPPEYLIERGVNKSKAWPSAWFPMLMAATYLGIAIAARNTVIQFALERVPTALGRPIATLPQIQRQIGELDLALQVAQAFLLTVAGEWTGREADRAKQYPRIVAAKHLATETAIAVTDQALRIAGGLSITKVLPLERYFRDVRAGLMHPPAGDAALEIIGRGALESRDT